MLLLWSIFVFVLNTNQVAAAKTKANTKTTLKQFMQLSPDLQCSACKFVSKGVRKWVHRKAFSWKKFSKKKKRKWVVKSLEKTCSSVPEKVCTHENENGRKVFGDFNALMKEGGGLSGLSMGGGQRESLMGACAELTGVFAHEMILGYISVKRPGRYHIHQDLCFELTGACKGEGDDHERIDEIDDNVDLGDDDSDGSDDDDLDDGNNDDEAEEELLLASQLEKLMQKEEL